MGTNKGRKHFGEVIIEEVLRFKAEGRTHREISEFYGFEGKHVIKELLKRHRRKQKMLEVGIVPRKKGRPKKINLLDEKGKDEELKRLKMENDLLRSFLSERGRR